MHKYVAFISWNRNGGAFRDNRYSRVHEWRFGCGIALTASASPQVVPPPMSSAEAVDPEEALIAAASSCHLLSFLYVAAREGYIVDTYTDDAYGLLERVDRRKMAVTRIVLRPIVAFSGEKLPTPEDLAHLHHLAHEECYIANSLKTEIVVEAAEGG